MEIINNSIYLKENELNNMIPFKDNTRHIESKLYINEGLIYKVFNQYNDISLMKNKEKKISFLQNSQIEELIIPKYKLFINNKFRGHVTEEFEDCLSLNEIVGLRIPRKIELLTLASEALEQLHSQNIIIGDLNCENILFSDRDLKFCDADSISINGLPCDTYSQALNNQNINPFNINTIESDIYLINLIVLDLLLYYDVSTLSAMNKQSFYQDIKDYRLPKYIERIYLNLYNMINGDEEPVYPHEYLHDLQLHLTRKR